MKLLCTVNGCTNNRHRLGGVCYEHMKDRNKYGTYSPTTFNFRNDVSKPARKIYSSGFTSDTVELLASKINKLFTNPYAFTIEILKGSRKETLCSSKEKISRYIKDHYSKTINSHHIAIRLGYVFKLYTDGAIEAGGQLRFNLAKALLPYVSSSGQGLQIKEVIGNVALKNFMKELMMIADELNSNSSVIPN
ncbi:MAG: hypothetical protein JXQ67_05150 [Campylobacterales bacterium]|nr:hypothetical protein [Campylobacterales bacterium]